MGSSCYCPDANVLKDIRICPSNNENIIEVNKNDKLDKNIPVPEPIKEKDQENKGKVGKLKEYFDIEKTKSNDKLNAEKRKKTYANENKGTFQHNENKYDNMLKRLLNAQKDDKHLGPKRRESIRKSEQINNLIKEVIEEEQKNNKLNNDNKSIYKSQESDNIIISLKDKIPINKGQTINSLNLITTFKVKEVNSINGNNNQGTTKYDEMEEIKEEKEDK